MTALISALGHGTSLEAIPFLPGILYVYEKVALTHVEAQVQIYGLQDRHVYCIFNVV